MADDVAGAVRRTPRPVRVPELWWSPTECMVYADRSGAAPRYLQMRDTKHFGLPLDVVQLVGPDQRRPVVLLRADDCDCGPPYADCEHGPEPVDALDLALWLHAEVSYFRNWTLKAAEQEAESHGRAEARLRADLKHALWLHAEAKHQHAELLAQRDGWWSHCNRERDALQARIDAALALIDYWDACGGSIPQGHRLRAALQGDQPTEPDVAARATEVADALAADPEVFRDDVEGTPGGGLCGATNAANPDLVRTCTHPPHPDDQLHMDHWTTWWGDDRQRAAQPTGEADRAPGINVRLAAGQPGGGSTFVEIEDDHGRSVRVGHATTDLDGTWSIRITAADIAALEAP